MEQQGPGKSVELGLIFGRERAVWVSGDQVLLIDENGGSEVASLEPAQMVEIIKRLVERVP